MEDIQNKMSAKKTYDNIEFDEINWKGIFQRIWMIRVYILKSSIIGVIVGLVVAFSIPKEYTVSVCLSPELHKSRSTSGLMSLASSFLGRSAVSGNETLSPFLAPTIVSSTPFLLEILESKVVNEDAGIDTVLSEYLKQESLPWWSYIIKFPRYSINLVKSLFKKESFNTADNTFTNTTGVIHLSKKQILAISHLRQIITTTIDADNGVIYLTTTLQDPIITAVVADSVVSKLQKYIINHKIAKVKDDLKYWTKIYSENEEKYYEAQKQYAEYVDANSDIIYQSTNVERERLQNEVSLAYQGFSQVAQELQMVKARVQESKPAFTVIEPPVVPLKGSEMSKIVILIICIIGSIACSIFWELGGSQFFAYVKTIIKTPTE